jgi:hypothetical protein
MDVPEWLTLNDTTFYFKDMNFYQVPIYLSLSKEVQKFNKLTDRDEKLRQVGVLGYLITRLQQYKEIIPINLYTGQEMKPQVERKK